MVKRTLLIMAFGSVFFTAQIPAACACSCAEMSEAEHFERSDAVFTGTVTERRDPNPEGETTPEGQGDKIYWTFDVEGVRKGEVTDPQEVVSTRESSLCGYQFRVGERYEVFANRTESGELETGACSGNRSLGTDPSSPSGEAAPEGSSELAKTGSNMEMPILIWGTVAILLTIIWFSKNPRSLHGDQPGTTERDHAPPT